MTIKNKKEEGFALVMTLIITAILSAVVTEFIYSTRVDAAITENVFDVLQAEYAARGAVNYFIGTLAMDAQEEENRFDCLDDVWNEGLSLDFGDEYVIKYPHEDYLKDECGKININHLYVLGKEGEYTINQELDEAISILFESLDISDTVFENLKEWLKPAEEEAEIDIIEKDDLKYRIKKGKVYLFDEFLLIEGFDSEMLYGDPDDEEDSGLQNYISIYGDSDGKINANTASEEVLKACFGSDDKAIAYDVISSRNVRPFETMDEFKTWLKDDERVPENLLEKAEKLFTVKSQTFSIKTNVEYRGINVTVDAVVKRAIPSGEDDEDGVKFKFLMYKVI